MQHHPLRPTIYSPRPACRGRDDRGRPAGAAARDPHERDAQREHAPSGEYPACPPLSVEVR